MPFRRCNTWWQPLCCGQTSCEESGSSWRWTSFRTWSTSTLHLANLTNSLCDLTSYADSGWTCRQTSCRRWNTWSCSFDSPVYHLFLPFFDIFVQKINFILFTLLLLGFVFISESSYRSAFQVDFNGHFTCLNELKRINQWLFTYFFIII